MWLQQENRLVLACVAICGDARAAHDDGGFTPFRSLRYFPHIYWRLGYGKTEE
jgi:hypothetical protein